MIEPPTPAQALQESAPLCGLLYPAFEYATEKALSYIESEHLRADPFAFALLVRWHVARRLALAGHEVVFDCDEMAMIGLSLTFAGNNYRIRKADSQGQLPPPGHSQPTQEFYAQQLSMFTHGDGLANRSSWNFVILWHVTGSVFKELSLVFPRSSTAWAANWDWHTRIPYPMADIGSAGLMTDSSALGAPSPDLGLKLKPQAESQTKAG